MGEIPTEKQLKKMVREKAKELAGKEELDDSQEKLENESVSRRSFLKLLGVGAGSLALSSTGLAASLSSGTTIGSNTAWHAGNDGSSSGLIADQVDGHEILTDTLSNRPSAGTSGRLFYATDGEGVFHDNGSSWEQVSAKVSSTLTGFLLDDWQDNALLSGRDDFGATAFDGTEPSSSSFTTSTRPSYSSNSTGDATGIRARNQRLEILLDESSDSGFNYAEVIHTNTDLETGTWDWDFNWNQAHSGSGSHFFDVQLITDDTSTSRPSGNKWIGRSEDDGGGTELLKVNSGSTTTVISDGTNVDDGSDHTQKVTRDSSDNWEMFVDGSSIGTATDSFSPSVNDFAIAGKMNDGRSTAEIFVDNMRVF